MTDALHDVQDDLRVRLPGNLGRALVELGDLFGVFVELGTALGRNGVDLALALLRASREVHVFQELKGGVDDPRAGAIDAAALGADGVDDLVPVPWLPCDG